MRARDSRLQRLQRAWQQWRVRRWDRLGGPGPVLRWSMQHRWLVSIGAALILAVVLGATFGVPPVSPLILVLVFVAPVPFWLRTERNAYERWRERPPPPRPHPDETL